MKFSQRTTQTETKKSHTETHTQSANKPSNKLKWNIKNIQNIRKGRIQGKKPRGDKTNKKMVDITPTLLIMT